MTATTPKCIGCGAKFSLDHTTLACNKCGLPAEISDMGPQMVARWKYRQARQVYAKRQLKKLKKSIAGGSEHKRKKAHGRQ